jgi:O-antigen/teichoic acid export membrane protein
LESVTRKLFVLGATSQYFAYFVGIATSVITVPVYLHFLGQDTYGLYVTLSSIVSYFILFDVGIGFSVPKYVAEYSAKDEKENLESMLSTFLLAYLIIFVLALVAGIAIAPGISKLLRMPDDLIQAGRLALIILAANFGILMVGGLYTSIFTGMRRVYIRNLFSVGQTVVIAVLSIIVLWLGGGMVGICIVMASVSLIQLAVAFLLVRRQYSDIRIKPRLAEWSMLREVAFPTLNYFIIQVISLVVLSTDNIVIGAFIGVGAVAPYSIAFRFCRYFTSAVGIPTTVLYPFFSDWYARGKLEELRRNHRRLMKLTTILAVLIAIFTVFFGPMIIKLWVGNENYVGNSTLYIFCIIIVTSLIVQVSATLLAGIGKHAPIAYLGLLEAAMNLVLSIIFVRYWGVFGVALATVIAGLPTNLWFAPWYTCRILEDSFLSLVVREIAPAIISGSLAIAVNFLLVTYVLPDRVPANVITGVFCCCLYLVVVRLFLKKEELMWLYGIVKSAFRMFKYSKESK